MSAAVSYERAGSPNAAYGIITMRRPPANALNQDLIDGLIGAIDALEADPSVKGFLLTSSVPGFFSAGIDLTMFIQPIDQWLAFWMSIRTVFLRIYNSRLVSIACVQGHAPGGGAILSLACQYRFMLNGKFGIGLNEVAVGLAVPMWLCDIFAQTVGTRTAERVLPLGLSMPAPMAKEIGLIDQVFSSEKEIMDAAIAQLNTCFKVDQFGRLSTIAFLRRSFTEKMIKEESVDMMYSKMIVGGEVFQKKIRKVMASIASKKTKSKI